MTAVCPRSPSEAPGRAAPSDHAARKRAKRSGRETGCWAYISGEALERAAQAMARSLYRRPCRRNHISNGLWVFLCCHTFIHAHPRLARERGWIAGGAS